MSFKRSDLQDGFKHIFKVFFEVFHYSNIPKSNNGSSILSKTRIMAITSAVGTFMLIFSNKKKDFEQNATIGGASYAIIFFSK